MRNTRFTSGPMPLRLIGALAGVSLSLLLSSCGGGDKTSDTPASDSASTTTTTTTATTSGATSDSTAASTSGATSDSTKTTTSSDTTSTTSTSSDSSGGSGTAPAGWKPYTSEEGKYSTSFPSAPKESTSKTAGGREMKSAVAETDAGAYMVMYMNLGSTPDKATTEKSLDGAAKSVEGQGKLVSSKATTFEGQPAREVVVEKDVSGKQATITDMIFINKDRLDQVMTVIAKGSEETANTKKFQDAFKLTDKS